MGVVFIAMALFFVFLTQRFTGTEMALLYSNLESADSSQILRHIESQGIPYQTEANGTQILVPTQDVARVRMSLAAEGLPGGSTVGYEIFDDASAIGTTNFLQNINLVRALEGEISRTIRSLKSVRNARVHLVLAKRQLFSREKQKATASVVLKMRGSNRISKEQVSAIQHLVAAAVPELDPTRVSVIDDRGNLLARGNETDTADGYDTFRVRNSVNYYANSYSGLPEGGTSDSRRWTEGNSGYTVESYVDNSGAYTRSEGGIAPESYSRGFVSEENGVRNRHH